MGLDGGGVYVLMQTSYSPYSGLGAHYEPFEKRPMKGDHMSSGNVWAKKLVGVLVPKEKVQSGAHRDTATRPRGTRLVMLYRSTR